MFSEGEKEGSNSGTGENISSQQNEATTGRTKVHKLDGNAYKPWGSRSRASSDAGSDTSFCLGGPGKSVCGEPVRSSEYGVSCDKCETWFHASCQGISKPAYDALSKYPALAWLCPACKNSLRGTNVTQITSIESKVDEMASLLKEQSAKPVHAMLESKVVALTIAVEKHMKLVAQSMREQEQAVDAQNKMMERTLRDNATQKASYAEMVKGTCSDVVSKVSEKLSSIPRTFTDTSQAESKDMKNIAKVFDDFLDKDKRKNNLVLHNLPEADYIEGGSRAECDVKLFQELVKDTFKLNVAVSKSFRVGKINPDRDRLLIVTLDTPGVKYDILRLAPQLRTSEKWGKVYITPDLTKAEREAARKLRQELADRRAAGETNLSIRRGRVVRLQGTGITAGATRVGADTSDATMAGTQDVLSSDNSPQVNDGQSSDTRGNATVNAIKSPNGPVA